LDATRTSPYKFYQYWLNSSDEDAKKYIKVFTLLDEAEITDLITEHDKAPHTRLLQKRLGEEITKMVHSEGDLKTAIEASNILFGKATSESLKKLSESDFLSVFDGVPQGNLENYMGKNILDTLVDSGFLKSKSEARRALKENSISVNKEKVTEDFMVSNSHLISEKYILLQRGKKNYFLVTV
jgi:tyrosyl-tRNA synthetase